MRENRLNEFVLLNIHPVIIIKYELLIYMYVNKHLIYAKLL